MSKPSRGISQRTLGILNAGSSPAPLTIIGSPRKGERRKALPGHQWGGEGY
jgi:hypothetical protein